MQVTLELPDQSTHQWGATPEAAGCQMLEDAAIERYHEGRLSQRQMGGLLGLDYWQTEALPSRRGVPMNYSPADLDADSATLKKILTRSLVSLWARVRCVASVEKPVVFGAPSDRISQ